MTLNEVKKERPWSNLPSDILSLIQSHLFGRDYIYFLAVCRAWRLVLPTLRQIPHPASETITYPSLLYFSGNNSLCNVFNPKYNSTSSIDIPELTGARIHYSKDGWLLMSQELQVLFFHPFTKQIINLPKLPDKCHYYFNKMSFSSPPTSRDCVVIGIVDLYELAVEISFICRGEDSWTSFTRRYDKSFYSFNSNPVYHNGAFYCLSREGTLAVFDLNKRGKRRWMLLYTSGYPCEPNQENFLVECNGELVSVLVGHLSDYVSVYKFNRGMKAWQEVKNLGDHTIFVSLSTSISVTSSSLQVQGMENKVYFPRFNGRNGVFYSLATCKFHSFGFGYTAEDLYNTWHPLHCTWIIPTFQLCCDEELEWISIPEPEDVWHPNPKEFSAEYIQNSSFKSNISTSRRSMKSIEEKRAHPWLVVSHGKCYEKQTFFNMLEDQYYIRSLPQVSQKLIATCSYGWLVLVDMYSNDCFLLNPITMEKIQLPPREKSFCYDLCVLTSSPNRPNCLVLFVENCEERREDKFMFCWLGDDKWTIKAIPVGPESGNVGGVVSFGGKIYGLTSGYREFVMIDIHPTLTVRQVGEALPRCLFKGTWSCKMSLVESCGELFALKMLYYGNGKPTIVMDIEVYKMGFIRMKWERVKNLGDQAFFWSHSNLTSCSGTESGIKRNTIYFTEANDRSLYAFDLKDGSIYVSLPFPNVKSHWSQPTWVMCLV